MFFNPHNFPEFKQNFGISVPMKMTKKKKSYFFIYLFFLYKECYLWFLAFWYLRNLKTPIIHISRSVLSFRKHKVLCM